MPRYIDADAIHYVEIGKGVEIALASDIDKIPTISTDEVRGVGEWVDKQYSVKCSFCHTEFDSEVTCCDIYGWPWKFCPNCGARMGGVQDA